jgi:ring-1,2-phenylacetyl-CoA epoxidase subunit PaaD
VGGAADSSPREREVWRLLEDIPDPEIPVLSIVDLGIVRAVRQEADGLEEVLSPPWTSDWLTSAGREKLRHFGIAPPEEAVSNLRQLQGSPAVSCPRCGSRATERVSEFGSTPCKAHYRCRACAEPFDYFKCL